MPGGRAAVARPRRVLGAALIGSVAALALQACSGEQADASISAPSSVPGPSEQDLGPGWDERGDGEVAADADLSPRELADLLRLPATATSTTSSCQPDDVALSLTFTDAAMGHRFGALRVENTSPETCSVQGYPGFGARGQWGSAFQLAAEQRDPIDPGATQDEVMLAPGESAVANVEWTGELAGAESEPISLLVVQLTSDGEAIGHPVSAESSGDPSPDTGIDISMMTTVRVGPLHAASGY